MPTWKLVLADDHRMVRQGLRAILELEPDFELVGEAENGLDAIRLTERLQPDVLILDWLMPELNGLEVTKQVARRAKRTRVVVLSMHSNLGYVVEALRAGANAYVLKEASADDLVQAIRAVMEGKRYFSAPISEAEIESYLRKAEGVPFDLYDTLTEREREVLQLTAEGHSGNEIADRLFISPRTVESHRANLMRKLNVRNQKELIRFAMQRQHDVKPGEANDG
jgi:DNA-binding NarL/FixJ family response regulator